jgi:type IV pilus assembly protein PilO
MATTGALAEFARMPTQRKIAIFAVIGLVLGLGYWKLVHSGIAADETAARDAYNNAVGENGRMDGELPKFTEMMKKKPILDALIVEQQRALPTKAEVEVLWATLERKFAEAGVTLLKVNRKQEEPIDQFVKVPLDIEISGTFMQIKRFFASLVEKKATAEGSAEEQERVVTIENLSLGTPAVRSREIVLNARFTAVTFRQEDPKAGTPTDVVPAPAEATGSAAPAPLPSAATPAGAKARAEDGVLRGEQRTRDGVRDAVEPGQDSLKKGR